MAPCRFVGATCRSPREQERTSTPLSLVTSLWPGPGAPDNARELLGHGRSELLNSWAQLGRDDAPDVPSDKISYTDTSTVGRENVGRRDQVPPRGSVRAIKTLFHQRLILTGTLCRQQGSSRL